MDQPSPYAAAPRSAAARPMIRAAAAVLGIVLLVPSPAAFAKAPPESFADLAAKLLPAVVNISTTQSVQGRTGPELPQLPPGSPFEEFFKEFFDRNRPQQPQRRQATSLGSGFIIDANGLVVTNNHVIQDAEEITVILHDNTRLKAKLVGRDAKTDMAVLKVETSLKLTAVPFGDSDKARVGDWVVAIGNPFGLGGTVTAGIISARNRDINSGPYDDFIQTDASINRGNSGGPLFNMEGQVIGINTAIFSPSGGSVGIGFAIPTSGAKPIIDQLVKHGEVRRGWLGVHIQVVTPDIAESLGLKEPSGALVASVMKDGPAEKAKIQNGDVILKFDGKDVTEMRKLPRIVAETEIGRPVDVEVWRNGKRTSLKATVGELKETEPQVASRTPGGSKGDEVTLDSLGVTVSALTAKVRERFNLDDNAKGVVVTAVKEGGPAAEKGISAGDLIVEASQEEVNDPAQLSAKLDEARRASRKSVLLLLEGQGGLRFVAIRIGEG